MIEFIEGYEDYFGDWVWEMSIASLLTLELMLLSFLLSCFLGLLIALLRISKNKYISNFSKFYIGFFRGVPVLVILYWIYFEFKRGQTIGKKMMQIKTIKIDGSDQDLMSIIILTACKTSLIPFDVLFGVLFFRGKKERVSNRFTNTIVVSE